MNITYTRNDISFEWDSDKAFSNWHKHEIAFETACEVFFDPFFQQDEDEFVEGEMRERVIGLTTNWQLLYVVYTLRSDTIRIISARSATNQQRKAYETQ